MTDMFEFGLIGYGSMGSMLLNGFLEHGALSQDQVIVSTRTRSKLDSMKKRWPGVTIADGNAALAKQSKIVLIAVKPREVKPVLEEIACSLRTDSHLVFISAGVMIENVSGIFPGKISKMIPSMTMETGNGIALSCHNNKVDASDAARIEKMFGAISTVKGIDEKDFEAAADLTSCAPGFFAAIVDEFVKAGTRHSSISRKDAEAMVIATLYGSAKLLAEKGMSPDEIITRVATKGGITEEGVKVLRTELPSSFDHVFDSTLGKYETVKKSIREQFDSKGS